MIVQAQKENYEVLKNNLGNELFIPHFLYYYFC
nr:MAG TPA: hypothetical protein [Caudoviricetes sp.]